MKFLVYGVQWAGGAPDPKVVLEKFFGNKYKTVHPVKGSKTAIHFEIDISDKELANLIANADFDILISPSVGIEQKFMAFDGARKFFRQR